MTSVLTLFEDRRPSGSPVETRADLELWGGAECSVVRVHDRWRDQLHETGYHEHLERALGLVAETGVQTFRAPFLLERSAPEQRGAAGWAWHDRQMNALRRLGIAAVGSLLHHGSGPAGTSVLDPGLSARLSAHAGAVARRYPDIALWTPVNEPLTTARFSCLYGYWFPHLQREPAFLLAVVNQCRAVLAAMRAIRAEAPAARFLHTEDLGRIFATTELEQQARYENERRWLSLDLLCGRLNRRHPWWTRLLDAGIDACHLDELATGEAAPDLLGINHYVTSDRFLDHRLHLYPEHMHGGNGRQHYVDTEAVRAGVRLEHLGWQPRLAEAWSRYGIPLVLSEVHLGCEDARESARWLNEAWRAALILRCDGADIRAVVAWAMFGLVDWNTMLRSENRHYETGHFDLRADPAVRSPLHRAAYDLGRYSSLTAPVVDGPGWWRAPGRLYRHCAQGGLPDAVGTI